MRRDHRSDAPPCMSATKVLCSTLRALAKAVAVEEEVVGDGAAADADEEISADAFVRRRIGIEIVGAGERRPDARRTVIGAAVGADAQHAAGLGIVEHVADGGARLRHDVDAEPLALGRASRATDARSTTPRRARSGAASTSRAPCGCRRTGANCSGSPCRARRARRSRARARHFPACRRGSSAAGSPRHRASRHRDDRAGWAVSR